MRRKLSEAVRSSDVIDEVSDDDDESSTHDFVNPSHLSEIERAMHLAEQGAVSFNDVGGPHFSLQQPIPVDCVYVTPKDIEAMSDHFIIFIWDRNFSQIIEFLRLRLLSATHCILLVTSEPLSSTQWFLVGRYVGIKVLIGSCSDTQLLVHAGAERALGIAVFPQHTHAPASSSAVVATNGVVDSASILIYNMAKKLQRNVCCFIEVADTRSFAFLTRDNSLLSALGITRFVFELLSSASCCIDLIDQKFDFQRQKRTRVRLASPLFVFSHSMHVAYILLQVESNDIQSAAQLKKRYKKFSKIG
jgi:hypothetical protein